MNDFNALQRGDAPTVIEQQNKDLNADI